MSTKVSVVVPTTTDRGPLLPYSVGSVLRQSVTELEVLVVGDGVSEETADTIDALARTDSRVRFFPFPKGERRGEKNRDSVLLNEARGDVVCYLCDRDLMLPNHVESVLKHVANGANFVATGIIFPRENGKVVLRCEHNLRSGTRIDRLPSNHRPAAYRLSSVGHTMALYRELPERWSTTPESEQYTDVYMWKKFIASESCRAVYAVEPTILWFKRGDHPGWPTERRLPEIRDYADKIQTPEFRLQLINGLVLDLFDTMVDMKTAPILLGGFRPKRLARRLLRRFRS